jgi:hypothetical protein
MLHDEAAVAQARHVGQGQFNPWRVSENGDALTRESRPDL